MAETHTTKNGESALRVLSAFGVGVLGAPAAETSTRRAQTTPQADNA